MRTIVFTLFLFVLYARGVDDRFGIATGDPHPDPFHFGVASGWNQIATTGAGWDFPNPWDIAGYSSACAWLATTPTPPVLSGTSATLVWNESSTDPVVAFNLYVGKASGVYGPSVNIGNVLSYTISGLTPSTKSFVAVTAVDAAGKESVKSNEVSFTTGTSPTPAPTPTPISGINPSVSLPMGYTLRWNQDFTAASYSPFNQATNISLTGPPGSIWHAVVGQPGGMTTKFNGEGDPYSTAQGCLTIHANGGANPPYGGLMTSSANSYNVPPGTAPAGFRASNAYWEIKALIPAAGCERWPVLWVIGSSADAIGGQYGEIDISEFTTSRLGFHTYTVVPGTPQTILTHEEAVSGFIPAALSSGWHVFGCLIQPAGSTTTVSIYIDGILSRKVTGLPAGYSSKDEVILSNSLGPDLPASGNSGWTNDLGVQYVRCWTPQ
jgi:hypothetical protein